MKVDIKTIVTLVIVIVVAMYIIAYALPNPAQVVSNSTGTWGAMTNSPGVFQLAAIVVPLVLMVALIMYFIRKGTD